MMAENNEFLREVDEDYRRDRILQIWKRYSGVIIALAVLVVAGVAGWRYWQNQQRVAAETASVQFDERQPPGPGRQGRTDADKAFDALEAQGPAGYRLLARFRTAAETGKRDPAAGAAANSTRSPADTGLGDGLRDLARLRAALLRLDGQEPGSGARQPAGLSPPAPRSATPPARCWASPALKKGD